MAKVLTSGVIMFHLRRDTVARHLGGILNRAKSGKVANIIFKHLYMATRRNFDEEGRPVKWSGLLYTYKGQKVRTHNVQKARAYNIGKKKASKIGLGRSILWWTGEFFNTIGVIKRWIFSGGVLRLQYGSNDISAATHNFGRMSANIRQRRFIYISDEENRDCNTEIGEHIVWAK